ncbi:unnamed protein product [Heligmosomoides polygyrus]|uniref:Uncharacterized protein n=1 Tax=Heligmosomoides polygyrus TaxID=6339 RepID=A0A183F9X1_HELPZ|nr:unnamed protein product [Heligmosomoides polygyrus]
MNEQRMVLEAVIQEIEKYLAEIEKTARKRELVNNAAQLGTLRENLDDKAYWERMVEEVSGLEEPPKEERVKSGDISRPVKNSKTVGVEEKGEPAPNARKLDPSNRVKLEVRESKGGVVLWPRLEGGGSCSSVLAEDSLLFFRFFGDFFNS